MSGGKSKTSGTSSQNQSSANSAVTTKDPWRPAVPLAKDFLGLLSESGGLGLSGDQQEAFSTLKGNALQGNPWAQNLAGAANSAFAAGGDLAARGQNAYNTAMGALSPTAQGQFVDPSTNPYTENMVGQASDEAFNRIRSAFAGAGRDITGNAAGLQAAAKGVTQASLPILFDQYNRGRQEQMQAAGQLPGMVTALGGQYGQASGLAGAGGQFGDQALDARNYSAERMIDLDQKIKQIPRQDLSEIASLLFPMMQAGGVGTVQGSNMGQGQNAFQSKSSNFGFNLGSLFG